MVRWHHQLNEYEFEHTGRTWRTEEAGMGWQRVENDLVTEQVNNGRSHTLFTVMPPVHVMELSGGLHSENFGYSSSVMSDRYSVRY